MTRPCPSHPLIRQSCWARKCPSSTPSGATNVLHFRFWPCYYTTFDLDIFTTHIWFWPFYFTTLGSDHCTTHSILTFLLHNIWCWPLYCTTLGFDRFTTQLLVLTNVLHIRLWHFLLYNIWFWLFYYTTWGFDLFTAQHWVLTVLLHNSWFWPLYYTTFGFDIFTTQHLILTFLLHNICFRPFDYTTLGFDRFTRPDSIWIDFDGVRGGGRVHKIPKFGGHDDHMLPESVTGLMGQCTTKPNFAVRCTEMLRLLLNKHS